MHEDTEAFFLCGAAAQSRCAMCIDYSGMHAIVSDAFSTSLFVVQPLFFDML